MLGIFTPFGINLVSLLQVSLKYWCTPFERTIISSAYLTANFSPNFKYLVANPAWSYDDNRLVNQNEENYVNKAGVPYRVYRLEKDMKFKVSNIEATFAVGDEVEYDTTTETYVAGTDTGLKVVAVEEVGFPYCIGSIGAQVIGDTGNEYGYATGAKTTKYTIEVTA